MESNTPPSVRSFLPLSLILAIPGWFGLVALILWTEPSGGTRWAMYFLSVIALTGTALPFMAYLNRRFPSNPPPSPLVIIRQALWVGIYFPFLVFLQISRVFTLAIAILVGAGFIGIEILLRLRERSLWKP
jgi:hypothetical protein